ncbi:hypothetical protein BJ741DRAFT_587718 [Chytriomyces cf. hyalinus JEL632]|nr:hypothetical protein BJ741DRAFT_587718 [Chytriomyces cf. hyalinus JEL632]
MQLPQNGRAAFAIVAAVLGLISLVASVSLIATSAVNKNLNNNNPVTSATWDTNDGDRIIVYSRAIGVDVASQSVKFQFSVFPSASVYANNSRQSGFYESNVPINLTFGSSTFSFSKGSPLLIQTTSLPMLGDSFFYPFDGWECLMPVFATYVPLKATTGVPLNLPVVLAIVGNPNGFDINYDFSRINDDNTLLATDAYVTLQILRSKTTKGFAIFISTAMWCLVLSAVALAGRLWVFERKVDPPHIAFTTSLLFALPGLRNAMPEAPAIGVLVDQICLVWGMGLLSACLLVYYTRFNAELGATKQKTVSGA